MSPHRFMAPATQCAAAVFVLAVLLPSFATSARGQALPRGLAVVLDADTLERTGSIGPSEFVRAHVVLLAHDLPLNDGIQALQFGLELDPRLQLSDWDFDPRASAPIQLAPTEWAVGLGDCLEYDELPFSILTIQLVVAPGVTELQDLRVDITEPASRGEPILFAHCRWHDWNEPLANFGGLVLNPSGVHLLAAATDRKVVVEGRHYDLGWVTTGADSVQIDGNPQSSSGLLSHTANGSLRHEIRAFGGNEHQVVAFTDVEVIRQPRILHLLAHDTSEFGSPRTQISWDVEGVDAVELVGVGSFPPRTTKLVEPNSTGVWELTAANEWGSSSAVTQTIDPSTSPPVIARFDASPVAYTPGDEVSLRYLIVGADEARIEPGVGLVPTGDAHVIVRPDGAITYTLTAANANGTSSLELELVPQAPVIKTYSVLPNTLDFGDTLSVIWEVSGATQVTISPEIGEVDTSAGALHIVPSESALYSLTATNPWGQAQAHRLITVKRPTIHRFQSYPPRVHPGGEFRLSWEVYGATRLVLGDPEREVSSPLGYLRLNADADSVLYWLRLEAPNDTLLAGVRVVWMAPLLNVTFPSDPIYVGEPFNIRVSTTGADSLHVSPDIGPVTAQSHQTLRVTIDEPTEFVFTATNPAGATVRSKQVVPIYRPLTARLSVWPLGDIYAGSRFWLGTNVSGADSARVDPHPGWVPTQTTSHQLTVDDTTTFVLTAWGRDGVAVDTLRVNAILPRAELRYEGGRVQPGDEFELLVVAEGASHFTLLPVVPTPTANFVSRYRTRIDTATTFVLSGTNPLGTSTDSVRVEVVGPPLLTFEPRAQRILAGQSTELTWSAIDANSVQITGEDGSSWPALAAQGSIEVSPALRTQYTLTAENGLGTATTVLEVDVVQPHEDLLTWSWQPTEIAAAMSAPEGALEPGVPFQAYVVARIGEAGLREIDFQLDLPPGLTLVEATLLDSRLSRGAWGDALWFEFDSTDECVGGGGIVPLLRTTLLAASPLSPELALDLSAGRTLVTAEGGAALRDCAHEIRPVVLGDPLYLQTSTVSAVTVALHARRQHDGIHLEWASGTSFPDALCARNVRVLRARATLGFEEVGRLDATVTCASTSWVDASAPSGALLRYRVVLETASGAWSSNDVLVEAAPILTPARSRLLANVPNPFNPRTEIRFELAAPSEVRIEIFDVAGRRVRSFDLGARPAGSGAVVWTGEDDRGAAVASGVYIVGLRTRDVQDRQRVVLVR